jgi:SAM-dependent methyltransferase
MSKDNFYEKFWEDFQYQQSYAFDSAVRDRYPAIQAVWGDLKKPVSVLDFGSGNGVLSYWLKSNGFGEQVVGVDVSQTGVDNANRAYGREGLNFATLDKLSEFKPGTFDVVVSSHVLEHIDEPAEALQSILDKAEWLVLEVPLEQCLWPELSSRLTGKVRADNPLGHVNFWTRDSFRDFLAKTGLMVVRDYHYASAPFSPFNSKLKRVIERIFLATVGLKFYSKIMATHYVVLARKINTTSTGS